MTKKESRTEQINDFLAATGYGDWALHPLAGDASFRRYIRIRKGEQTAMLMDAPPERENVRPYLAVARYLKERGFSAPRIIADDIAGGFLLLEDLGDDSFTQVLKRDGAQEDTLYRAAIELLAQWHGKAEPAALKLPAYDQKLLLQEVRLLADWFLPQVVGKDAAESLASEYLELWRGVLAGAGLATDHFVHRDYHADNLMWLPGRTGAQRVGLLDFQDGVYGDPAYDLVSLLEDARRDVPPALAQSMLKHYLDVTGIDRERFTTAYAVLGAQRNSKIVGIFVRLAARDGKHQYLHFLPRVWRHLEHDLSHPALAPVRAWADKHIPPAWRGSIDVRLTARDLALSA